MKRWQETREIYRRLRAILAEGRDAALAQVVRIDGSAYRRPGAKMLVEGAGGTAGGVSGGCLEADVREVARTVLNGGPARALHYDTGDDDSLPWGLGLGCNGAIDIAVHAVTPDWADLVEATLSQLEGDAPFALATGLPEASWAGRTLFVTPEAVVGTTGAGSRDAEIARLARQAASAGEVTIETVEREHVLVDVLLPPPRLLICGAGDDAQPLASFASEVGFRVTVADHRPEMLTPLRFPTAERLLAARPADEPVPEVSRMTFAVVMTHGVRQDRAWLKSLLAAPARYIGMLGPRSRTERLVRETGGRGDPRVFGPVGLDLGGEGPAQVAAAIVAEMLATWSGRPAGHLRDRTGPINRPPLPAEAGRRGRPTAPSASS